MGAEVHHFDEDVEDEEDNLSQEVAEVEHGTGYSEELSDYDSSPLSDDSARCGCNVQVQAAAPGTWGQQPAYSYDEGFAKSLIL